MQLSAKRRVGDAQLRAAMLGELGADQSKKVLEAAIKEADAILAQVEKLRREKERKSQKGEAVQGTFPPPGSLLEGWVKVLTDLELQLLETTKELAAALKGKSDRNLFDLLAVVNQLLDILAKLHQKADTICRYTLHIMERGEDISLKEPFQINPAALLGDLAVGKQKIGYPIIK